MLVLGSHLAVPSVAHSATFQEQILEKAQQAQTILQEKNNNNNNNSPSSPSVFSLDQEKLQQELTRKAQQAQVLADQATQEAKARSERALVEFQANQEREAQRKADKLAEYDELFRRDAQERDTFYGQMYVEKRAAKRDSAEIEVRSTNRALDVLGNLEQELDETTRELTRLEETLITSSSSDQEGASLTRRAIVRAQQRRDLLRRRLTQEQSLDVIRNQRQVEASAVRLRAARAELEKQKTLVKIEEIQARERLEFEATRVKKQETLDALKYESEQLEFERKLETFDKFATRKGLLEK